MRNRLSGGEQLLMGLILPSMPFGTGNLVFLPFLGVWAGSYAWIAMAGSVLSIIGFSALGVVAVVCPGGLDALVGRARPVFAFVFTLLIHLSTGPCLATPRTISASFEMTVASFVPQTVLRGAEGLGTAQLFYSTVFLLIALLLALKSDKLSDRLGKILTSCLLTLILLIFVGRVLHLIGGYGDASGAYERNPMVKGSLEGYLIMDTIAALNLGIIIALSIQAMGVTEEKAVVPTTVKAGITTGIVLMAVYGVLIHIRAMTGETFGAMENGAQTLNRVIQYQFGNVGVVVLAAIFLITCLDTCVGLFSCCNRYLRIIVSRVGYRTWVFLFTGASLVILDAGLNQILGISVPVLDMIYLVAIVLTVLAFLHPLVRRSRLVYPVCTLSTGGTSIGPKIPALAGLMTGPSFYDLGLQWIVPAAVGGTLGVPLPPVWKRRGSGKHFPE